MDTIKKNRKHQVIRGLIEKERGNQMIVQNVQNVFDTLARVCVCVCVCVCARALAHCPL